VSLAEQPAVLWRRSQVCNPIECVEVALCEDRVLVRDSKNPGAGVLEFTRDEWRAFLNLSQGRRPGGRPGSAEVGSGRSLTC
jgi:hypothetical protein